MLRSGDRLLVVVDDDVEPVYCEEVRTKLVQFLDGRNEVMVVQGARLVVAEEDRCSDG